MLVLGFIQDTYLLVERGKIFYYWSNGICSSYKRLIILAQKVEGCYLNGAISDRSMSTQRYEYRYLVLIFKIVNLYQTIANLER